MSTVLYYFTGSGNSLVVARDIARKFNANLIPISSLMNKSQIQINAVMIGIVFPVYYAEFGGIPLIVKEFVGKLKSLSSKYIFAVCTHAGKPGRTIENFGKLLKLQNGKLAGGFTVKMSVPYSVGLKLKKVLFHKEINMEEAIEKDAEKQQELYDKWKKKLQIISNYIHNRKKGTFETTGLIKKIISAPFLPLLKYMFKIRYKRLAEVTPEKAKDAISLNFRDLVHFADKSFQVNEKCNGCGICVQICPVNNIKMVENKPEWQHHCETCYACFYWCPNDAINGEIVAFNKKFHHPEVKLSDMIKQNEFKNKLN